MPPQQQQSILDCHLVLILPSKFVRMPVTIPIPLSCSERTRGMCLALALCELPLYRLGMWHCHVVWDLPTRMPVSADTYLAHDDAGGWWSWPWTRPGFSWMLRNDCWHCIVPSSFLFWFILVWFALYSFWILIMIGSKRWLKRASSLISVLAWFEFGGLPAFLVGNTNTVQYNLWSISRWLGWQDCDYS